MSNIIIRTKGKADAIDAAIGARLHQCRKQLKLSAAAVAKSAGVSVQQLQKYETGQNRVSCGRMLLLAEALGKRPSFFFGESTPLLRYVLALDEGVLTVENWIKAAEPVANDLRSIRAELLTVGAEADTGADASGGEAPSEGP